MRLTLPVLLFSLLAACTTTPPEEQGTTGVTEPENASVEWPGYYEDTLPCADCKGIYTQLWVRSDSTFILRQRYLDKDSLAVGTIGEWHLVNGLMTVGYAGDKPDFYRYTAKGLHMVDEMGQHFAPKDAYTLEKLADEINDEIPRMRVTGTFTYRADAMSFQPCGSTFNWPAAGGEEWTDEGEVLGSMSSSELERNYLKAVKQGGDPWVIEVECNMAMGPAMEGDGADEYLFIHRVLGATQCP